MSLTSAYLGDDRLERAQLRLPSQGQLDYFRALVECVAFALALVWLVGYMAHVGPGHALGRVARRRVLG